MNISQEKYNKNLITVDGTLDQKNERDIITLKIKDENNNATQSIVQNNTSQSTLSTKLQTWKQGE